MLVAEEEHVVNGGWPTGTVMTRAMGSVDVAHLDAAEIHTWWIICRSKVVMGPSRSLSMARYLKNASRAAKSLRGPFSRPGRSGFTSRRPAARSGGEASFGNGKPSSRANGVSSR